MLEYLEKFNNLPSDIKQKISSGEAMGAIEELEKEYGLSLASFVMRVMVGELYYKNITANLIIEFDLEPDVATRLEKDLNDRVFAVVMDYLTGGMPPRAKPAPEVTSPFYANKNIPVNERKEPPQIDLAGPVVRRAPSFAKAAEGKPVGVKPPVNYLEEDEKDIAAMGKMPAALKNVSGGKNEALLAEIIKEASISFSSEQLLKRFKEIISTYLRSVRTRVEVKENLLKDVASGGVRMDAAVADRVLAITQKKMSAEENKFPIGPGKVSARTTTDGTSFVFNAEEIRQAKKERENLTGLRSVASPESPEPSSLGVPGKSSSPVIARDAEYDLSALRKKQTAGPAASAVSSLTGIAAPARALKIAESPEKERSEKIGFKGLAPAVYPSAKPEEAISSVQFPEEKDSRRSAAIVGNKKRMDDIKPAPRIMSPIDELAYMDLVNFRRLDPDPAKRAAKIEERINLLEKEGIDKKILGIRAWRTNPVSKTYLSMGQESIGGGKNIDDIIKERKDQGLNYLTKEEFEAVMDLNDNLRF